ncbi:MAG: lasso peptide biosynthesis B2 protein [Rhodobacteraceae bacterium]|nr:lasso peptide biosynthesis B2 protein [Paracoccaceae bacterium]
MVLEALAGLFIALLLVRLLPFRKYSHRLGTAHPGEYNEEVSQDQALLKDIRWAVNAVNRAFGGCFTCLMQGMAGKAMLNRRGVSNSLVLGVKINRDKQPGVEVDTGLAAHAWLWAGKILLLGGEVRDGYVPVTSYFSD